MKQQVNAEKKEQKKKIEDNKTPAALKWK